MSMVLSTVIFLRHLLVTISWSVDLFVIDFTLMSAMKWKGAMKLINRHEWLSCCDVGAQ